MPIHPVVHARPASPGGWEACVTSEVASTTFGAARTPAAETRRATATDLGRL